MNVRKPRGAMVYFVEKGASLLTRNCLLGAVALLPAIVFTIIVLVEAMG